MKRTSLLVLSAIMLFVSGNLFAQVVEEEESNENLDSFYEISNSNRTKKPFVYPYVRDADVVWKQRVWRLVDFREKMNQPFYYPREEDAGDVNYGAQGRANLFTVLDRALRAGEIKCYKDDEFKEEEDYADLFQRLGGVETVQIEETNPDDPDGLWGTYTKDSTIFTPVRADNIKKMRIKEDWYVDKQRSVRDVRIIAFALVYDRPNANGEGTSENTLGWIRYNDPAVRNLLANAEMYNPRNDVQQISYDDVFVKRLFTSYVLRTSNVYNRRIADYLTGLDALLESEAIEEEIFNREQDMWEY